MKDDFTTFVRWQLILGTGSEQSLGNQTLSEEQQRMSRAIEYLYGREYEGEDGEDRNVRGADLRDSNLTVPLWINEIHELFPKKTIERIEKDALERYQVMEMVTNPELLKRASPNVTLLKAVLHTRYLMNPEVLNLARELVRKVVEELMKKLETTILNSFQKIKNRNLRSSLKIYKNFDVKNTIRFNLKHYDQTSKKLILQKPLFHSRIQRSIANRWQLLILVDQSGSMLDSVIHSAVTASIFWGIKTIQTRLILFDTEVVDVTDYCSDPVETLMKVQLGGGTDIGSALSYAEEKIDNPRRTIIVLISDFFEGGSISKLVSTTHRLAESGVKVLGLAALDETANPNYDRGTAEKLVKVGAEIAAMSPGELANWVSEKIN
ncbi:VWA domain-containing protein [Leptospira santarosai]|uniref:VWA domain-containing protein n=1 Tax=Leptospira santarosai TaxID=28183 RepID=UPI0024AEE1E2|nr:VWA domain-containing protein [Leptospira santarosai]MDI7187738.1 VWA domain-containing protein [Leptospira santarosai]MDI7201545.1 VWA domain-containing protein [Leptospira santarosai]